MTDKPITSFAEASDYLSQFYVNSAEEYKLDTMRALMKHLGNPQEKFKAVHVAGTSGKTSTVYYISALLAATGKKVGLTVSPHIDKLNERLQINNVPLPEKDFGLALAEFSGLIASSGTAPSWFEVMVAFAYWYFAKVSVDYAVVEVGLGGLLDGTNVINRPDKVCVITDIGPDHVNILGGTLSEIAYQKAGIIHAGNVVFTHLQADEIMRVFEQQAQKNGAELRVITEEEEGSSMPAFQLRNWHLAYEVYKYLANRDGLKQLSVQELGDTQHISIPGRMDVRQLNGKTLIMDGAHNVQKMATFLDSFEKLFSDAKPAMLISLKNGKEYQELAPLLKPFASRLILTAFEARQDVPSKSMDLDILLEAFRREGIPAEIAADQHEAYQKLISGPEKICIITGSFYLLGQIRNNEQLV
jgi:dihydrofolate synthase/folylpolyglutamate synthase